MNFNTIIDIEYGDLRKVTDWCVQHCKYNWYYEMTESPGTEPGKYRFHFTDEKDFFTFMVWEK